jgi:hypothetical protein
MYNLSKYFDINNKFTIIVKKEIGKNKPKPFLQPKMVFKTGSYESMYEHTIEKIKELRESNL